MKKKIFIIKIIFLFLTNCGYNIVDQNFLNNYTIIENKIIGDNRVAYLLRNKLKIKNINAKKSIILLLR